MNWVYLVSYNSQFIVTQCDIEHIKEKIAFNWNLKVSVQLMNKVIQPDRYAATKRLFSNLRQFMFERINYWIIKE